MENANVVPFPAGGDTVHNNPTHSPGTRATWDSFVNSRIVQPDVPADNGFNLSGYELPEPVLESILCRLPVDEILKCNVVCRAWKDLITRKSFWKKCYEYRDTDWNRVPIQIKEKSEGWMVLYAQFRYNIFSKNYVDNHSGHRRFEGWTLRLNGGDGWEVEVEPVGCDVLPDDKFFGPSDKSCFVTSYGWGSKHCVIDLWESGVTPAVLRIGLPLEIKCSQMYTSRFDCGGVLRWKLKLLNSEKKLIKDHEDFKQLPASMEWKVVEHSFKFKSGDADRMNQIRYVVFIHEGKDTQFWAGHYGMKLARACVTVQCLDSDPVEEPDIEIEVDESGSEVVLPHYGQGENEGHRDFEFDSDLEVEYD